MVMKKYISKYLQSGLKILWVPCVNVAKTLAAQALKNQKNMRTYLLGRFFGSNLYFGYG